MDLPDEHLSFILSGVYAHNIWLCMRSMIPRFKEDVLYVNIYCWALMSKPREDLLGSRSNDISLASESLSVIPTIAASTLNYIWEIAFQHFLMIRSHS